VPYCKTQHNYFPEHVIQIFGDVDVDSLMTRMKCERGDHDNRRSIVQHDRQRGGGAEDATPGRAQDQARAGLARGLERHLTGAKRKVVWAIRGAGQFRRAADSQCLLKL
jgi:hypothetical protein